MALDPEYTRILENVLRALSTATRSLRLYPPTSPIPRQTVDAAVSALNEFFAKGKPDLKLTVAARGLRVRGRTGRDQRSWSASNSRTRFATTASRRSTSSRARSAEDLLGFLSVVSRTPEEVRAEGGISSVDRGPGRVHGDPDRRAARHARPDRRQLARLRGHAARDRRQPRQARPAGSRRSPRTRRACARSLREFVAVTGEDGTENLADALSGDLVYAARRQPRRAAVTRVRGRRRARSSRRACSR